ncbi:type II toxin-antitoxin system RelE/ParE family toxin [Vibrio anguillarum]|uniref:type II toxin-antitoxin system RelE/ParE family toxin n=1 Tax=Vibrio anguillarum TaxID=55601 RepID=UPI00188D6475|nr:type II toxin-antitoxin system RelE/ParE family toxin [Vibrio anguillarum]MBF4337597.1 type II toxin-antitoxin system RelE/ParE family toxin [Vibrio anguillarum]
MVLKFAFVNDAAEREYKKLPEDIQDEFGKDLRKLQFGQTPTSPIQYLDSVGAGVVELKINGSPAYRCVYVTKYLDTVVVLHSFVKTTNGTDKQAMKVATQLLKELKAEIAST